MKYSISTLMDRVEDDSVQLEIRNFVSAERVKELTMKQIPPRNTEKKRPRLTLRLTIAAAAVVMLVGGAMAVRDFRSLGEMDDIIADYGVGPQHELTVREAFAAPDAPDTIQEYYLPTVCVSADDLVTFWMEHLIYDENGDYAGGYYYAPFSSDPEESVKESPLLDTPTDIFYAWFSGTIGEDPLPSVSFYQRVAKHFKAGDSLISIGGGDLPAEFYAFELDGCELYAFDIVFPDDGSGPGGTGRTWFWTDGDYLFQLSCPYTVSLESMTEIFRSIRPVGSAIPYVDQAEEIIAARNQNYLGKVPGTYYCPDDVVALGLWQNGNGEGFNYRAFNFTASDGRDFKQLIVLQEYFDTSLAKVRSSPSWFAYDSSEKTTVELDGQTILCSNYYRAGELAGRQWKYERDGVVILITAGDAISEETLEAFCRSLTLVTEGGA